MTKELTDDVKWLRELAKENDLSLARTERRVLERIADRLEELAEQVDLWRCQAATANALVDAVKSERDELRKALENLVLFINSEHDLHAVFVTKDSPAFAAARTALGKEE